MLIKAVNANETHDEIDLDIWAEIIGIDRAMVDELFDALVHQGHTGFGEWELTEIAAP